MEPDEEAENTITSIQKIKNPTAEDGQLVFSHPEGLFSLSIPASWDKNTNNSNFFENYIFKDPLQEIEIWVTNTFAKDYSEDEFYRDLASLLMERSGGQMEISPAIRKKGESGHEWFFGKVEIKSEPIQTYRYWIKEHEGRFWAITEVYPQTSTDTASNKFFEIRRSFSFGAKPEPDHK